MIHSHILLSLDADVSSNSESWYSTPNQLSVRTRRSLPVTDWIGGRKRMVFRQQLAVNSQYQNWLVVSTPLKNIGQLES